MSKYKVTMTNVTATPLGSQEVKAEDYVPEEKLEGYVADAETRWQLVTVSDEPDDGPGGPDGETQIPESLGGN